MKFTKFLNEETVEVAGPAVDVVDTGKKGKQFEQKFIKALEMVGLKFEVNRYAGRMWDIKPKGSGWQKITSEKPVNIKVSGTKWMFGTSDLYKKLPWDKLPEDFDEKKAGAKVKRFLNKKGLADVVYMKPIAKQVQNEIMSAVDNKDVDKLNMLLVKKNFYVEKLGKSYSVRILTDGEKVTSVAIDKGGKVFMRSEKPRNMKGTMMVTFRTPTTKLGKAVHKPVKIKENEMITKKIDKYLNERVDMNMEINAIKPQVEKIAKKIADGAAKSINAEAKKLSGDFPYKAQMILETLIEELQTRV